MAETKNYCPNCGGEPIQCVAKKHGEVYFCGINCIREFLAKERQDQGNTSLVAK